MSQVKELWLLVADGEHARLLHGTLTTHGRVHLAEASKLATSFVAGEHQRPTRMSEPGRSGLVSHEKEEKLGHFAREFSTWIHKEIDSRHIAVCHVFAPSHFLGALRKELPKSLEQKLQTHEGEIANLTPGQLAEHPKVAGLMAQG